MDGIGFNATSFCFGICGFSELWDLGKLCDFDYNAVA
jgi:hypothetical protein